MLFISYYIQGGCHYLLGLKNMKRSHIIRLLLLMDSFLDVINYHVLNILGRVLEYDC